MKKTSRRSFSKAIAAGLVSLPAASLANAVKKGGHGILEANTAEPQRLLDARNQHDTPPTFVMAQGSFIVEIDKPLAPAGVSGGKKRYRRPKAVGGRDAHFDHIKIVDGSGEMLYRNDNARDCEIVLALESSLEVKVFGGRELMIEMTDSLDAGTAQSGPRKRPHKYVPSSLSILAIKVQRGTSVLYSVARNEVVSKLEDARIMVWHEDH